VIEERAAHYRALSSGALETELRELLARHEQYMDRECVSLYTDTNVMNPRAAALLASSIGSRPSLGYPGASYEMGMRYAEFRVGSGSLASLYAFMACARPGDGIMAFADTAAGHVTHHRPERPGSTALRSTRCPSTPRR
jgi:glycine hydroxymethyltransferase